MAVAALSYLLDQTVTPGLTTGQFDFGPLLKPEFVGLILDIVTSVALIFSGLSARDNKVTSEQALGIPAVAAAKAEEKVAERQDVASAIDAAVR